MERSEIRDGATVRRGSPGFRFAASGLRLGVVVVRKTRTLRCAAGTM
jgi:hypothetical protein